MRRMMIIFMVIGFCYGLFGQPKPFDPDYYRDTLKVKKSNEFKKLENYREKYKKLGLPSAFSEKHRKNYPTYLDDLFYHRGINLDSLDAYRKLGFFKSNDPEEVFNDVAGIYFKPVIVIGKVKYQSEKIKIFQEPYTVFEVKQILKGIEYYKDFPNQISCYFLGGMRGYGPKPKYFNEQIILFLDTYITEEVDTSFITEVDVYGKYDTFFNVEYRLLNQHYQKYFFNDLLNKVNEINRLSIKQKGR